MLDGGCSVILGSKAVLQSAVVGKSFPMSEMSLSEAQLFRMLVGLFGRDRVVWNMSVRAVCGGGYPVEMGDSAATIAEWAEVAACLFTVVDFDDVPKMVVEFAPDFSLYVDVKEVDRHQKLPHLLDTRGVRYVSITKAEFIDMTDSKSSLDLVSFLKDKFGVEDSGDSEPDIDANN